MKIKTERLLEWIIAILVIIAIVALSVSLTGCAKEPEPQDEIVCLHCVDKSFPPRPPPLSWDTCMHIYQASLYILNMKQWNVECKEILK
jgi:hypothetical protein